MCIPPTSVLRGPSCCFPASSSPFLPGSCYYDLHHHQFVVLVFVLHIDRIIDEVLSWVQALYLALTVRDTFVLLNGAVVFHHCVVFHCANTAQFILIVGMESDCCPNPGFLITVTSGEFLLSLWIIIPIFDMEQNTTYLKGLLWR